MRKPPLKIYFDGGHRPQGMELAVVLRAVAHRRFLPDQGSAMEAEWRALIWAAEVAVAEKVTRPLLLGDALGVIEQASGKVRVPSAYAEFYATFQMLREICPGLSLRHVKRKQNLAGNALEAHHAGLRRLAAIG